MKIAAYTTGKNFPCSRLRIRQYIQELKQYNIKVTEYCSPIDGNSNAPKIMHYLTPLGINTEAIWEGAKKQCRLPSLLKSNFYDLAWLERGLHPKKITNEHLLKRYIYDIDDALWLLPNRDHIKTFVERAKIVFAGNNYVAEWCKKYNSNIEIIPTAIDLDKYNRFRSPKLNKGILTIGWIGTKYNLVYLKVVEKALKELAAEGEKFKLKIVSDGSLDELPFEKKCNFEIEFVRWTEKEELYHLNDIDIGIMPLPESEFVKGKCSYKMLQYMGFSKPVIVTSVGMNMELLKQSNIGFGAGVSSSEDWYKALKFLINNESAAREMGNNGYQLVEEKYSVKIVSKKIYSSLQNVAL